MITFNTPMDIQKSIAKNDNQFVATYVCVSKEMPFSATVIIKADTKVNSIKIVVANTGDEDAESTSVASPTLTFNITYQYDSSLMPTDFSKFESTAE